MWLMWLRPTWRRFVCEVLGHRWVEVERWQHERREILTDPKAPALVCDRCWRWHHDVAPREEA